MSGKVLRFCFTVRDPFDQSECRFSESQISVRQTTKNDALIYFSMGSVEECINTSIVVSENMVEYFSKNLNYVVVF